MSVIKAKSKLPYEFTEAIYNKFSERNADKILEGMIDKYTTLRVNTIKSSNEEIIKVFEENGIDYDTVDWYENAFIIKNKNEKDLQKLDIYKDGKIYLQSLSSMVPPLILNPKPGEKVLDLTAAPGSKTTQMAALMNNKGEILANEIDKIRFDRLEHNIKKQGVTIATVTNEDGRNAVRKKDEYFDKVLLDVPCSGEGRFIIDKPDTYSTWSIMLVQGLTLLQKELIDSAFKALKPGGELVYSTCTLNREENEKIVNWALNSYNLELEQIHFKVDNMIKGNNKHLREEINKTIKILPSKRTEGFYIAKFKKIDIQSIYDM